MKRILITAAIGAVLGLSGCGDKAADPAAAVEANDANDSSQVQASATVNFAVQFPGGGDATTAVIDINTDVIAVAVYRSPAADWPELEALRKECFDFMPSPLMEGPCADYYLMEDRTFSVASGTMTPDQPTTSMNVLPGSYLIVATQFDSAFSMANGDMGISNSRSLVTLAEGNHNVVMSMLHGTWTMVDDLGAAAPITLQLLNNSTLHTDLGFDWDKSTPNVVETSAEAMGITGPIVGSHFLGMGYFVSNYGFPIEESTYPTHNYGEDDICYSFGCDYIPILRVDDGVGGVTDVMVEQQFVVGDSGGSMLKPEAAALLQSYDPVASNSNIFSIGGIELMTWDYDAATDTESGASAGLFSLVAIDEVVLNGPPVDDGTDYIYPPDSGSDEWVDEWFYQDITGVDVGVYVASVDRWNKQMTHPNTETPASAYDVTEVVDGSTIRGTLIEYIGVDGGDSTHTVVTPPDYMGADPTGVMATSVAVAAALELEAAALGLKAVASSSYGNNCLTITDIETELYLQYMWSDASSSWIPGLWNDSYQVGQQFDDLSSSFINVIMGEDIDGDGIVEPFESAFYNPYVEYVGSSYDPITQVYTPLGDAAEVCEVDALDANMETCYIDPTIAGMYTVNAPTLGDVMSADLDADGVIEQQETVLTELNFVSSTVDVCLHPFILNGAQLDVTTSAVEVVISSN